MEISGIHIIFNLWCWSLSQSAFVATQATTPSPTSSAWWKRRAAGPCFRRWPRRPRALTATQLISDTGMKQSYGWQPKKSRHVKYVMIWKGWYSRDLFIFAPIWRVETALPTSQGGDCKKALIGLPRLRPVEYARLKNREKRVNRAYGGSRCASCVRQRQLAVLSTFRWRWNGDSSGGIHKKTSLSPSRKPSGGVGSWKYGGQIGNGGMATSVAFETGISWRSPVTLHWVAGQCHQHLQLPVIKHGQLGNTLQIVIPTEQSSIHGLFSSTFHVWRQRVPSAVRYCASILDRGAEVRQAGSCWEAIPGEGEGRWQEAESQQGQMAYYYNLMISNACPPIIWLLPKGYYDYMNYDWPATFKLFPCVTSLSNYGVCGSIYRFHLKNVVQVQYLLGHWVEQVVWTGGGLLSQKSETASKWFQVIILCFTFHRSLSTSEWQMITVCIGSGCVTHHINHHGMFHLCSIPGRRSEVATNGCVAPAAVCEMGKGSEAAQRSDPTGREICRWHKDIGIPKIA